ncbi:MAG: STAS domain-containing protein [Planctomycetota bacterium]|nr:STAS domain-containing protein [Planctomycetota bacterium]
MNARFDDHGTLCIVSLEGEFIGDAVDPVRTACLDRVDSGIRDLILDLSSTEMVDSAGLEAMLALADATATRRGRCMIAEPDEAVRSILSSTRLHERLEIHDAVETAARTIR